LKASVSALAPNVEAIKSSRTKPVMRDTKVKLETIEADLNKDTATSVARQRFPLQSTALLTTSTDT
jgi:hypothetical protein